MSESSIAQSSIAQSMMDDHSGLNRSGLIDPSPGSGSRVGAEVISLDTMRHAMVANFEQDDLDVPAFLRKRGEVM